MVRALYLEAQKCTGCLQCEMACSYENEGVFNPAKSRIKVFAFHDVGRFVPYTCTQCEEAWCMHACPVDAITLNELTGSKDVLENACVGCKVCTIACPFGTVNYNQDTGKVMKCDLCGGDPVVCQSVPHGRDHVCRGRSDRLPADAGLGPAESSRRRKHQRTAAERDPVFRRQ